MDPTVRFAALVAQPQPAVEELALCIAAHARRGVDVDAGLARLDRLAEDVGAADAPSLMAGLFASGRFRPNPERYYEPANSYLDVVMERGLGIPVTLSVVAVAVGRRVGVPLVPVGMPGHVIVREVHDANAFWDPFGAGRSLDLDGVERLFRTLHGLDARFSSALVEPTGPAALAERMLSNLHRIFLGATDRANLVWVLRLRTMLPGADLGLRRQLAGVLDALGRHEEAAGEYDVLASLQPDRGERYQQAATRSRANLN